MHNDTIFAMDKDRAFTTIYKLTFPDDYDDDYNCDYDVTPFNFADNSCFVFMIANNDKIRILSSKLEYIVAESHHNLKNIKVMETYITSLELEQIVVKLEKIWEVYN